MSDRLTRKQREIRRDLRAIIDELGLDFENAPPDVKKEYRAFALHQLRVTIILGVIVQKYVLINERLDAVVCRFFFGRSSFIRLWRTKRFILFNYYILEKLSVREKLGLAKAIRRFPKAVVEAIERINAARNVVAHNFFPENARDLRVKKRGRSPNIPIVYPYKGVNVFTYAGLKLFLEDVEKVVTFVPYPSLEDNQRPRKRPKRMDDTLQTRSRGTTRREPQSYP